MKPTVRAFFDRATNTISYLVSDPAAGAAVVIDPVLDYDAAAVRTSTASADAILAAAADQGLRIERVLETHAHADHLSAAHYIGDTLFMPDYGTARTDFPGGDAATLYRSIQRILTLPDGTRLFVGHDYLPETGRKTFAWETTVGEERRANIHIGGGVSEADFVARRTARDASLDVPRLILPSLQVNIRAGDLPPPEASGKRFLKFPVNAL